MELKAEVQGLMPGECRADEEAGEIPDGQGHLPLARCFILDYTIGQRFAQMQPFLFRGATRV